MFYGNSLAEALRALGVAQVVVSDDFSATIEVDTAGAAKDATTIPIKSPGLPCDVYDGQVLIFGAADKIAVVDGDQLADDTSLTVQALPVALVQGDKAHPWESIGAVEGDITENGGWNENALTALQTGDIPHQATVTSARVSLTIPVIAGGARFWKLVEPTGDEDGPPEVDTPVKEKSIFLIPRAEIGAGLSYEGSTWSPAAPINSLFFPRAYLSRGAVPRPRAGGGKSTVQVTATPLYYSAGPAGKRGWVRGDPVAKGYTTFKI